MTQDNPFTAAEKIEQRARLLLFGPVGSLKSRTALLFPSPCVIDMEHGTELYGDEFKFEVKHTNDCDTVFEIVKWLLTNKHQYKTLVIDPITIYKESVDGKFREIFLNRKAGTVGHKTDYYQFQPSDYGIMKAYTSKLFRLMDMLDMNVVITAGSAQLYSSGKFMEVIGTTFDGPKNLNRFFNTAIQMWHEKGKFFSTVANNDECKDRTNMFPDGVWETSYKVIEEAYGDILFKDAIPVEFLSEEQHNTIQSAFMTLTMSQEQVSRAFKKYGATHMDELTKEKADELLSAMNVAIEKQKAKEAECASV